MNKIAIATFVALLSIATVAGADPADDSVTPKVSVPKRFLVDGTVGLGTPVGQLGIEGAFVAHRNLEIGVGFGYGNIINLGDTGKPNAQLAVMPRFRLPLGPVRITLGAGLSGGRYTVGASPFSGEPYLAKTTALWLNGELGADYELDNGLWFGAYVGAGKVIAHTDAKDAHGATLMSLPDSSLPSLGVRVGYSF